MKLLLSMMTKKKRSNSLYVEMNNNELDPTLAARVGDVLLLAAGDRIFYKTLYDAHHLANEKK